MAFPWLARDGLEPWVVRRIYLFWTNDAVGLGRHHDRRSTASSPPCAPTRASSATPSSSSRGSASWASEEGAAVGVEAAEAFRVVVIEDDAEDEEGPTHETPPGTEGGAPDPG